MHVYTQVNLKHPLITAHKVGEAAKKVFKKEIAPNTSGPDEDTIQRWNHRMYMQVFGCPCGFERMGC